MDSLGPAFSHFELVLIFGRGSGLKKSSSRARVALRRTFSVRHSRKKACFSFSGWVLRGKNRALVREWRCAGLVGLQKNATVSYFGFIFAFPCGFREAKTALPCESGDCTDFSGALGRQILSLFMGFCVISRVKCSCFMGFCVIRLVECPCFMGYFATRLIEYTRFIGFCAIWGYRKLQTEVFSRASQNSPEFPRPSEGQLLD